MRDPLLGPSFEPLSLRRPYANKIAQVSVARIFISYRREDSAGHTGRLHDDLAKIFGSSSVFMDIDAIEFGADFPERIQDTIADCDILLAIIGPHWITATDSRGVRRLDDPVDFVRLEIASALDSGTRVVPILVGRADMPLSVDVPDDLKGLVRRHALEISDSRWGYDVDRLVAAIRSVDEGRHTEPKPQGATPRVDQPGQRSRERAEPGRGGHLLRGRFGRWTALAFGAAGIGLATVAVLGDSPNEGSSRSPNQESADSPTRLRAACNPNYAGACIRTRDVDCVDLRQPVQIVGQDIFNLDPDNDGTGCESMSGIDTQ